MEETMTFEQWWAEVRAEAHRRGVSHLLSTSADDHRSGFDDGDSPADEVAAQIDAAHA